MAIDTFTWCARVGAGEQLVIPTIQSQFGDSYKQIASNGINSAVETWTLTVSGRLDSMKEVRSFLKSHVTISFWWTNPWGEKKLYRVKSDSIGHKFINGDWVEVDCTFEQSFSP